MTSTRRKILLMCSGRVESWLSPAAALQRGVGGGDAAGLSWAQKCHGLSCNPLLLTRSLRSTLHAAEGIALGCSIPCWLVWCGSVPFLGDKEGPMPLQLGL